MSNRGRGNAVSTETLLNTLNGSSLEALCNQLAVAGGWRRTVQPGEVWQAGPHRLMCGDSTNPRHMAKLMGAERAALVFTSPPYLAQRLYNGSAPETEAQWLTLMQQVFSNLRMAHDGQVLVNLGQVVIDGEIIQYEQPFIQWMRASGWKYFNEYIWDKQVGKPWANQRLIRQHEKILHFTRQNRTPAKTVEKKPGSILKERRSFSERKADGTMRYRTKAGPGCANTHRTHGSVFYVTAERPAGIRAHHPAIFPVELCRKIIPIWTSEGEVVCDPFCGSGTMIFAANELGRRCFGMEQQPEYCEIALQLFEERTGITPVKVL